MSRSTTTERRARKLATFARFAADLAELSACRRAKVGCVILPSDFSEVLAIGYNGPPVGQSNDACRAEAGPGRCGCVHAEANAIAKLSDRRDAILLCTKMPCEACAGLIANRRSIVEVRYRDAHHDESGLQVLRDAGITACQTT